MHYPASIAFDRDSRVSFVTIKVYCRLRTELDFVEVREVKGWALARSVASGASDVSSALSWLTEQGYLLEHGRGHRNVRRFTLTWTVGPRVRPRVP